MTPRFPPQLRLRFLPPWRRFFHRSPKSLIPLSSLSPSKPFSSLFQPKTLKDPTFFTFSPLFNLHRFSSSSEARSGNHHCIRGADDDEDDDLWTDDDDFLDGLESQIGDGGDGGGIVLRDVEWGERSLLVAREVLRLHFNGGDDLRIFAFKTSPRGYIYIRLDKLSDKYGCPSMEEIEKFSYLYKQLLDEIGEQGEIPVNLALEVSSAGAERLLKVPDDLVRFKVMPMQVRYIEKDAESDNYVQKEGVFMLESVETESEVCVWELANVKENRDVSAKGRPLSRKQRDWRLRLPFGMLKRVTFYMDPS